MTQQFDPRVNAIRKDLADRRLKGRVEAPRFSTSAPAHIVASIASVRAQPSFDAPQVAAFVYGENIRVFDAGGAWRWVQADADCYVGYVRSTAVADGALDTEAVRRVSAMWAHLYPKPDVKTPPQLWVPMGARLLLSPSQENGFQATANGFWVHEKHLLSNPISDWVAVAEAFIGTPYLWGGEGPDGIDCSGLIQVALEMAGHAVPRDSDMQESALGTPLPDGTQLQRGDLVFWQGHVGVMRDATALLHANTFAMKVASEPLKEAITRIKAAGGAEPTSMRRI